ncbi:hypothetical protein MRX96_009394 [Rhipicephalus microplus]
MTYIQHQDEVDTPKVWKLSCWKATILSVVVAGVVTQVRGASLGVGEGFGVIEIRRYRRATRRPSTLVLCCLLVVGVRAIPIYTISVPVVQEALHHTIIQPVVRAAEHHSTVVEHHPGNAVVRHHPGAVHSDVVHHEPGTVVHHHAVPSTVVHQTAPVVENAIVHHVLRPAVVAQRRELVYTPHHEHSYSLSQTKVTRPRSSVVEHHPLTGIPYRQTDVHHAPVVTGSHSSVHQSRPATIVQRTRTFLL